MHSNYMILKAENINIKDNYSLNMVLNNKIKGLLEVQSRIIDNKKQYFYDISAMQPVSIMFEKGQLSKSQIQQLILQIIEIIESGREFLLDDDDFVIHPDFIYINISSFHVSLCYVPGYQELISNQLIGFIEFLMNKIDYQDEDAVILTYGLYQLSREHDCTFHKLKKLLLSKNTHNEIAGSLDNDKNLQNNMMGQEINEDIYKEKISFDTQNTITKNNQKNTGNKLGYSNKTILLCVTTVAVTILIFYIIAKSGYIFDSNNKFDYVKIGGILVAAALVEGGILYYLLHNSKNMYVLEHSINVKCTDNEREIIEFKEESNEPINIGTEIIDDENDKTILLAVGGEDQCYYLKAINKEIYQDIILNEFPFFIGKLKTNVDYSIQSKAVSRYHAKIEKINELFFISDLNSTNGTYVNHQKLEPNEKFNLKLDDIITFANISYQFTN